VRDLIIFGSLGFNALASGLPGISRSVLASRLRHLTDLGVIAASARSSGRAHGYRLTPGGQQLGPVVMALRTWAERWVPEDPGMLLRDPDIVVAWLVDRVEPDQLPDRQVVLDLAITGTGVGRCWLVLERGSAPSVCISDPVLGGDRYVFVEAEAGALAAVAQGQQGWVDAVRSGGVRLFGEPGLVHALPGWFRDTDEARGQRTVVAVTA
jgi:DNA-binding HxlR family transcriptional regulator